MNQFTSALRPSLRGPRRAVCSDPRRRRHRRRRRPGGSATAYHLAQAGLDVLLLEKTAFPREKVCGDGLTPRAVRSLVSMGIDTSESAGWLHNKGLRIIGGGMRLEMPWPELASYPAYGLVRPRSDFDELLARQAQKAGAVLRERTSVRRRSWTATGRIVGVTAQGRAGRGDLPRAAGRGRRRQLEPAVPRDGHREARRPPDGRRRPHLLHEPAARRRLAGVLAGALGQGSDGRERLLPGYGWIFGVGDGTCNVGLGILNTSTAWGKVDYKDLLKRWLDQTPEEWGYRDENRTQPVRGAALPMGFNRQPHYDRGLLLVGDSGGMVNPFNGEGIAYAMESGELAAEVIAQALARPTADSRERALQAYPQTLKQAYGGYYTVGRLFVKAIGDDRVMKLATRHGLPHPVLMRFVLKLMANLTDPRGGDAMDQVINALSRLAPAA